MNYGLGGVISTSGELNLIRLVKNKLEANGINQCVVFDVGANNGMYADALLKEFSEQDTIYCFEPSVHSFKELDSKLRSQKNIVLVEQGLGSVKEKRKLYFDQEGSGWASVFERQETGFNHVLRHSEEIDVITLDEFCDSNNINRIHFMKADVEGFELEILKGAKQMLSKIDFIQFEFSFANYNSKTYLYDFFEILSDFKIYRVLRNGVQEIKYDPRYEILMTTNYLAARKDMEL